MGASFSLKRAVIESMQDRVDNINIYVKSYLAVKTWRSYSKRYFPLAITFLLPASQKDYVKEIFSRKRSRFLLDAFPVFGEWYRIDIYGDQYRKEREVLFSSLSSDYIWFDRRGDTSIIKKTAIEIDGISQSLVEMRVNFVNSSLGKIIAYRNTDELWKGIFDIAELPFPDDKLSTLDIDELYKNGFVSNMSDTISYGYPEGYSYVVVNNLANHYNGNDDSATLEDKLLKMMGAVKEDESMPLATFIKDNKSVLLKKVSNHLEPVFDLSRNDDRKELSEIREKINSLPKMPIPSQVPYIAATVKGLVEGKRKGIFVVGEMGVGKTFMSIVSAVLSGAKRIAVMCPTHLIKKWKREILEVYPDATIYMLNNMSISEIFALRNSKPDGIEFWIVGKEKAKLNYNLKPISCKTAIYRYKDEELDEERTKIYEHYYCPMCGSKVEYKQNSTKIRDKCSVCGEPLYYADNKRGRRYAVAVLLKKYFKFDLLIADEVHELKSETSAQGYALAALASISKKVLALTGTLMGGYASNLFYLLWRVSPDLMVKLGIKHKELRKFINTYGVLQSMRITDEERKASIGGKTKTTPKEKPGISPALISELLNVAIFIKLSDIVDSLPEYTEKVELVDMNEQQKREYRKLESDLTSLLAASLSKGHTGMLGKMINSLYSYPDGARRGEVVYSADGENVLTTAKHIEAETLPKEERLIEIVGQNVAEGRKVMVLATYTNKRDVIPDIRNVLESAGFSVSTLYSDTVKVENREEWLQQQDSDVVITNPRLIQTGLDLYEYPTIVFFQTGYSVFELRQASRRSWRIGQEKPVNVYYLAYTNTIQEQAMKLMASKMETALSVEGDLTDKGLAALGESSNSIVIEIARTLVSEKKKKNTKASSELIKQWNSILIQESENDRFLTLSEGNYEVVADVSVLKTGAYFSIGKADYFLTKGRIYLYNMSSNSKGRMVGRYEWRKRANGTPYAVCVMHGNKVYYIGKLGGKWQLITIGSNTQKQQKQNKRTEQPVLKKAEVA